MAIRNRRKPLLLVLIVMGILIVVAMVIKSDRPRLIAAYKKALITYSRAANFTPEIREFPGTAAGQALARYGLDRNQVQVAMNHVMAGVPRQVLHNRQLTIVLLAPADVTVSESEFISRFGRAQDELVVPELTAVTSALQKKSETIRRIVSDYMQRPFTYRLEIMTTQPKSPTKLWTMARSELLYYLYGFYQKCYMLPESREMGFFTAGNLAGWWNHWPQYTHSVEGKAIVSMTDFSLVRRIAGQEEDLATITLYWHERRDSVDLQIVEDLVTLAMTALPSEEP